MDSREFRIAGAGNNRGSRSIQPRFRNLIAGFDASPIRGIYIPPTWKVDKTRTTGIKIAIVIDPSDLSALSANPSFT
jgi:hypothetical protein